MTHLTAVTVSGRANEISSVEVNGVTTPLTDYHFTVEGLSLLEGTNRIVATVGNAQGQTASDSVSIRSDTTPPLVVIESPSDGARLIADSITVAGTVNDIIPGATVNEDDVSVTVNGFPAPVHNRTFILTDLPLESGLNLIEAVAVDRVGNSASRAIQVSLEPDLAGLRLAIDQGNNQIAPIHTQLPIPLKVQLLDLNQQPVTDRPVQFRVSRSDGLLGDPAENKRLVTLLTDAAGFASLPFTLGSRTGEGSHRVEVSTPGSLHLAEFCHTGLAGAPANIAVAGIAPLRGVVGEPLNDPLSVIVTDAGGNSVADVEVQFSVSVGNGRFGGKTTTTALTNMDGIASATPSLGSEPGLATNEYTASFSGNPGLPATFILSAHQPSSPEQTTISSVVQNSAGQPLEDVRIVVLGEEPQVFTLTGSDGSFSLANVSPGGHHVKIEGSSINDPVANLFLPDIEFAVEAISGIDNPLDQVVILPFLDNDSAQLVGGDEDVTLLMAGVSGFGVKVFANSTYVRDPDSGEYVQQPLVMSSSQVKFDKVPMPPPQGSTPLVVGTLQPGGVRFDPPAEITYPNVEGLAPGDVADVFAFHHDIGQYVIFA